jgi:phosphoesterase RecJ-like protein
MSTIIEKPIVDLLLAAGHVLLLTDERLDGDTLGSTLGWYAVLVEMGKTVTIYSPKEIPEQFAFLPNVRVIRTDDLVFADTTVDLMIICDCSDGLYIKDKLPLLPRRIPLVTFDHHSTNPRYGTHNIIEPGAASTADVVWRFMKRNELPMNKQAAQCLLTGVCTDTSLFTTSNTTTAAFEAAVELTKLGAKLNTVIENTMMNKSVSVLRIWGRLFSRLHFNTEFDALCTALTLDDLQEFGNPEIDTSSISNFLNASIDEADAILILRESDDRSVKGSMRSRGRDVAAVAARYGGGGHKLAAGFRIAEARLQESNGVWKIVKAVTRSNEVNVNFLKTS